MLKKIKKRSEIILFSIVYLEGKVLALLIQLSSSMDMVEEWTTY
jgi:hypothetical protein